MYLCILYLCTTHLVFDDGLTSSKQKLDSFGNPRYSRQKIDQEICTSILETNDGSN